MGAKAIQKGAQKKSVRDEKKRNNMSDPQKTDGGTRFLFLEVITPRIMDNTKKNAVNVKGVRNMVQWVREVLPGPILAEPFPPQARHVP